MELVEFEWLRSIDAFSLVERTSAPEKRGKWGVQQQRVGSPPHVSLSTGGMKYFELYRPTEFPALFRQFADMPATAEGMRDFLNKFGPLEWGSERFGAVKRGPGWCSLGTDVRGALIHHANLRRAVELFEAGNLSALSVGFNQGGWGRLRAELRPGLPGKLAIVLVPDSLAQFLWLQVAQYAGGDGKLFRCEHCNRPFLVGSKTHRTSKAKYCSDTCRLAAFRERQAGHKLSASPDLK